MRSSWSKILLLYACGVGAGLQFAKASVVFDALSEHYQAGPALAGWFVSAVGLVGVVFGATAGLVVARLGSRKTLIGALAAGALIAFAEGFLPPIPAFLALRGVEGAAHLAIVVAAPSALLAATTPSNRGVALGLWGTFMSVAFLVGGSAAPALVARFGLGAPFFAHAGLLVALALGAYVAAPADRPAAPANLRGVLAQHIEVYANARTATPALCFLCYTGMYLAVQTLTPELAPPGERAALIVGMAIVSVVASLVAGTLAQRGFSPFALTIGAFAATLAASLVVEAAVGHDAAIAPAALARMAFLSFLPGAILPMIPRLNTHAQEQARAFGALAQTGNVGSALGPPLFATSAAALGPIGLLLPVAALCVLGGWLTARAARRFAT